MRKIELFVDSVYHNVAGNKKDIQELKAEMTSHLLEAVHELKSEGKSEQEAIEIAIERFGGEKELRLVVGQLFKSQKNLARWLLFFSVAVLLIFSITAAVLLINERDKNAKSVQFAAQLLDQLGNEQVVSGEVKKEIQTIVKDNEFINSIRIYFAKEYFSGNNPEYSYEKPYSYNRFSTGFIQGQSNDTWRIDINSGGYELMAYNILLIGIAVYWALFTIWASISTYHTRLFGPEWVLAFAVFNIVGYLLFRLNEKKAVANSNSQL